jgi:hypothetical protein
MAEVFRDAHALVIGVGGDLPVTVDDAKAVAGILQDRDRCAIPADNVHVLVEGSATHNGIVDALKELVRKAQPGDAVTVYFSGHGRLQPGSPERRFLVPHDRTILDGKLFTDLLRQVPARRLLVLLDCCYAGGVYLGSGAKALGVKSVSVPFDVHELRLRGGSGTVVLSSSKDDEVSLTGTPYSIFTQVLIDALCGTAAARRDGYVHVGDLAMHLAQWVPRLTNDSQHPQLDLEAADNYPVAYYAAGSKTVPAKPDWLSEALTRRSPERPSTVRSMPADRLRSIRSAIRRLRDILAEWVSDEDEARRIVGDSGLRPGVPWRSHDATSFWQKVLENTHRAWQMESLFTAADEVFGENPDWREAKRKYRTACEAAGPGRTTQPSDQEGDTIDRSLLERQLSALRAAMVQVVPSIFDDPRISADKLAAAHDALVLVDPMVEALNSAAREETRQPRRYEMQQLGYKLQQEIMFAVQRLTVLESVRSKRVATRLCNELASEADSLLTAYTQAIHYLT